MGADLRFQCRCGAVKGVCRNAGDSMGVRVVCYCTDCQAFACFLGCESEYLDAAGGTDIYQTAPSRLEITEGVHRIRRVVVAPNGMHRFYADCCKTPLANTIPSRKLPFAGTFARNYDATLRDATLRPPVAAVFGKEAHGEPPTETRTPLPLLILDLMRRAALEWMSGKSKINPYLDAADAGTIGPPHVVSEAERRGLDAKAAARGAAA